MGIEERVNIWIEEPEKATIPDPKVDPDFKIVIIGPNTLYDLDIELLMNRCKLDRDEAITIMAEHKGDVVSAIMTLTSPDFEDADLEGMPDLEDISDPEEIPELEDIPDLEVVSDLSDQ